MKKIVAILMAACMLFALTACGDVSNDAQYDRNETISVPLGDTGVKLQITAELGFEAYESELNDFYGGGPSGEWRIIANVDLKSDYTEYTFEEYVKATADANNGDMFQDEDGNYYFVYTKNGSTGEEYTFYTAVREGADKYYRVAFYSLTSCWDIYNDYFFQWAKTIEVE